MNAQVPVGHCGRDRRGRGGRNASGGHISRQSDLADTASADHPAGHAGPVVSSQATAVSVQRRSGTGRSASVFIIAYADWLRRQTEQSTLIRAGHGVPTGAAALRQAWWRGHLVRLQRDLIVPRPENRYMTARRNASTAPAAMEPAADHG
jgi:hypothetical protein